MNGLCGCWFLYWAGGEGVVGPLMAENASGCLLHGTHMQMFARDRGEGVAKNMS